MFDLNRVFKGENKVNMEEFQDKKLKILVVLHKDYPYVKHPSLLPIQVNRKNSSLKLSIQGDDEGDNISEKNDRYCELTAMYWAWKNVKNHDYIGLFHYRRYMVKSKLRFRFLLRRGKQYLLYVKNYFIAKFLSRNIAEISWFDLSYTDMGSLTEDLVSTLKIIKLSEEVVFVPKRVVFPGLSVRDQYIYCHISEDWHIMETVIREKYPEFVFAYKKFVNQNKLSVGNIFIMGKKTYDQYCEWLFSILFEVEKRLCVSSYPQQKRVFGYMAERLLNIYIEKKRIDKALKIEYLELGLVSVG